MLGAPGRLGRALVVWSLALVVLATLPAAATARSLYVSNSGSDNVSAFAIGADDDLGAVDPLEGSPSPAPPQ